MGNHRENLRVNVGKHRLSHLGELFDGAKENDNFGSFFATVEREFKVSEVLMLNSDTVYCLSHNLILIVLWSALDKCFLMFSVRFCALKLTFLQQEVSKLVNLSLTDACSASFYETVDIRFQSYAKHISFTKKKSL